MHFFVLGYFKIVYGVCIEKVGNNTSKRQYDMFSAIINYFSVSLNQHSVEQFVNIKSSYWSGKTQSFTL